MQVYELIHLKEIVEHSRRNGKPITQAAVLYTPSPRYIWDSALIASESKIKDPRKGVPSHLHFTLINDLHNPAKRMRVASISNREKGIEGYLIGVGTSVEDNGSTTRLCFFLSESSNFPKRLPALLTDYKDGASQGGMITLPGKIPAGDRENGIALDDLIEHGIIGFSDNRSVFKDSVEKIKGESHAIVNDGVSGDDACLLRGYGCYGAKRGQFWALNGLSAQQPLQSK
ncbi:hypothetical protein HYU13_01480 [Candidatus Woesearchaeota archaeon]|nr:hypothetical protein [Candidatus Woesearchaeota archaeon]